MQLTPVIAIHLTAALAAVVVGPFAIAARRGPRQHPALHRALGRAWVALMLVTAISALFIRDYGLPNIAGYTPIHLVVPVTLVSLVGAFWCLARGNVRGHSRIMRTLYFSACVVTGLLTLLPQRFLGRLVWGPDTTVPGLVRGTPGWVWLLLAALLLLGVLQLRDRTASLARVSLLPLAMTVFSLWGTLGAFGRSPAAPEALWLWVMATAATTALLAPREPHARYDALTRSYRLPGSALPLALFLGMFLVRYAVGVRLAIQPGLVHETAFVLPMAALSGVFSGVFLGRAAQLWRLALPPRQDLATRPFTNSTGA